MAPGSSTKIMVPRLRILGMHSIVHDHLACKSCMLSFAGNMVMKQCRLHVQEQ